MAPLNVTSFTPRAIYIGIITALISGALSTVAMGHGARTLRPYVFSVPTDSHAPRGGQMPVVLMGASVKDALKRYTRDVTAKGIFPGEEANLKAWASRTLREGKGQPLHKWQARHGGPVCLVVMNEVGQLVGKNGEHASHLPMGARVSENGGNSLYAPPGVNPRVMRGLLQGVDHTFFIGGADVHPSLYGEKSTFSSKEVNARRDRREAKLMQTAIEMNVPTAVTCRSFQLSPLVWQATQAKSARDRERATYAPKTSGGARIIQDVQKEQRTQTPHRGPKAELIYFPVKVKAGSYFAKLLGTTRVQVNHWHHQGVDDSRGRLPAGIAITARADDGLPEALENTGTAPVGGKAGNFVGTQFHPELDKNQSTWTPYWKDRIRRAQDFQNTNPRP